MPPLEEASSESRDSEEEEGDGSEGKEDWQSTGEEGGNMGGVRANPKGSGDEAWELFSLSGVRRDSV
jgi:hypothetical protein